MQFPQIRIESQFAKLAINTIPANQSIQQPKADLSIEQPKAEMILQRTPSKLTIDQTEARADMDLKSIARRKEEFAKQGYEDWLSGLARVAQDGDELMQIEAGGNVIAAQAKRNSEDPIYDFNIGWIPSAGSVKIGYDPGSLDIEWQVNKPRINVRINKPIHDYTPGDVNIKIAQYNKLKIDFENLKHVGIQYEQFI